ncbi:MAG: MMPL family transporter, partial [Planctomycetaceae bacterium]
EDVDFSKARDGIKLIDKLTKNILERKDELSIADVRSVSHPQGGETGLDTISVLRRRVVQIQSVRHYVGADDAEWNKHATRLEIVFNDDPFSRNSIAQITQLEHVFSDLLPEPLQGNNTQLHFLGASASISDLKNVTDRDQLRIDVLVLAGVFAILVILLRRPSISAYLVITVFFSYLATLGVTFAVYWCMDPVNFTGLDWKVPMFLFTILIAVGEDYNIFLMTRIEEEQLKHGPIVGVTVALERTGGIISSCGVIMAGTFSSLLAGSLVGMQQLGFALAFGVLLDTFIIRPIMVPAYLILLHSGRFGRLGRLLGARKTPV